MAVTKLSNLPLITDKLVENATSRSYTNEYGMYMTKDNLLETSVRPVNPAIGQYTWYSAAIPFSDLIYNIAGKIFKVTNLETSQYISPLSFNYSLASRYKPGDRIFFIGENSNAPIRILRATSHITKYIENNNLSAIIPNDSVENNNIGSEYVEGKEYPWAYDSETLDPSPIPMMTPMFVPYEISHSAWKKASYDFEVYDSTEITGVFDKIHEAYTNQTVEHNFEEYAPVVPLTPATSFKINENFTVTQNTVNQNTYTTVSANISKLSAIVQFYNPLDDSALTGTVSANEILNLSVSNGTSTAPNTFDTTPWGPLCYSKEIKSNGNYILRGSSPWAIIASVANSTNYPNVILRNDSINQSNSLSERKPTLSIRFPIAINNSGKISSIKLFGADPSTKFVRLRQSTAQGIVAVPASFNADVKLIGPNTSQSIVVNPAQETVVQIPDGVGALTGIDITVTNISGGSQVVSGNTSEYNVAAIGAIEVERKIIDNTTKNWKYYSGSAGFQFPVVKTPSTETPTSVRPILQKLATAYSLSKTRPILPFITISWEDENHPKVMFPIYPSIEALNQSKKLEAIHQSVPSVEGSFTSYSAGQHAQKNTNGAFYFAQNGFNVEGSISPVTTSSIPNLLLTRFDSGISNASYAKNADVQPTTLNGYLYFYTGNILQEAEDPTYSTEYLKKMINSREYVLSSETLSIDRYYRTESGEISDEPTDFGYTQIDLNIDPSSVIYMDPDTKIINLRIGQGLKQVGAGTNENRIEYDPEAIIELIPSANFGWWDDHKQYQPSFTNLFSNTLSSTIPYPLNIKLHLCNGPKETYVDLPEDAYGYGLQVIPTSPNIKYILGKHSYKFHQQLSNETIPYKYGPYGNLNYDNQSNLNQTVYIEGHTYDIDFAYELNVENKTINLISFYIFDLSDGQFVYSYGTKNITDVYRLFGIEPNRIYPNPTYTNYVLGASPHFGVSISLNTNTSNLKHSGDYLRIFKNSNNISVVSENLTQRLASLEELVGTANAMLEATLYDPTSFDWDKYGM